MKINREIIPDLKFMWKGGLSSCKNTPQSVCVGVQLWCQYSANIVDTSTKIEISQDVKESVSSCRREIANFSRMHRASERIIVSAYIYYIPRGYSLHMSKVQCHVVSLIVFSFLLKFFDLMDPIFSLKNSVACVQLIRSKSKELSFGRLTWYRTWHSVVGIFQLWHRINISATAVWPRK